MSEEWIFKDWQQQILDELEKIDVPEKKKSPVSYFPPIITSEKNAIELEKMLGEQEIYTPPSFKGKMGALEFVNIDGEYITEAPEINNHQLEKMSRRERRKRNRRK